VRHRRHVALGVTFSVATLLSPGTAQTADAAPRIAWESDFDAALQRAQKESKPLLVAFLKDNEPANDETIQQHYTDSEIVKLSAKFVCLACCIGEHKGEDGNCTKFPGITCEQHQAIEKKARARWLVGEDVCTPQHVFCDPKGQVMLRKVYLIPKQALKKSMAFALNAVAKDPDSKSLVDEEKSRVDTWLKDLDSKNLEVRESALRELGVADDPRAIPAVLQRAKSGNEDATRVAAINALAKKGNYPAVKPLTTLLGDAKPPIVIRAAMALETVQIPDATPDLLSAIKKERRERVRGFLLRAAARSSPSSAAVREACLQTLKGASAQLGPCVLIALGRMNPDSRIIEAVCPLLTDKNQNTRALAAWVLGSQATPECATAIEGLLQVERTPEVKSLAASALKHCKGEKVDNYENLFTQFFSEADY